MQKPFGPYFLIVSIPLILVISAAFANETALSKARAYEIVADHIKTGFFPAHLNTSTYNWPQKKDPFEFMHSTLEKLRQKGLVQFTLEDTETVKTLWARLTPAGRQTPYAVYGPNHDIIGFEAGARTLFEITEMSPQTGLVYFSYAFEPNELGYHLGSTRDEKNLGRAKLVYDRQLNDYVFKGFEYYAPESQKWVVTTWASQDETPARFFFGIVR